MHKSEMLPGLTAEQWARPLQPLAKVLMSLTIIFGAAYFLSGSTAATVPPWLYALLGVTTTVYLAATFIAFALIVKARREAKAGYTTTGGMHPEVPQIDSLTGEVLREVREDFTVPCRLRSKKRLR